jgi:hypothetical protein
VDDPPATANTALRGDAMTRWAVRILLFLLLGAGVKMVVVQG